MMGAAVDIEKTIRGVHDEKMKQLFTEIAESLIGREDYDDLVRFDQVVKKYDDLSRTCFGLRQKVNNMGQKEDARRYVYARWE